MSNWPDFPVTIARLPFRASPRATNPPSVQPDTHQITPDRRRACENPADGAEPAIDSTIAFNSAEMEVPSYCRLGKTEGHQLGSPFTRHVVDGTGFFFPVIRSRRERVSPQNIRVIADFP